MWLENRYRYLSFEKSFRKWTNLFAGNVPKDVFEEFLFSLMYVCVHDIKSQENRIGFKWRNLNSSAQCNQHSEYVLVSFVTESASISLLRFCKRWRVSMKNLDKFLKVCWPRRSPVFGVFQEYFTFREKYKPVQDIPVIILNASEKPSRLFVLRHNVSLIDLFRGSSFGEWRQRN